MTTLADAQDVQDRLDRPLTAEELDRLEFLLVDASATIRTYTGQQFTETSETVRVPVVNGRVTLPQRPVTAVSAVLDMNGNAVTFEWYSGTSFGVPSSPLNVWELHPYSSGSPGFVDVTYTYGYDPVPDVVVKVCCQIAARALEHPADQGAITEEALGEYSYRLGSVSAAGGLLAEEKQDLEPYRRGAAVVWAR